MRQQLPDCDVLFSVLREIRQVLGHRIVQPNLALFDQLHDRSRRGDHLRERSHIEYGVDRHRLAFRFQCTISVRLAIDHLAVVTNQQHRARNISLRNRLIDNRVDRSELYISFWS